MIELYGKTAGIIGLGRIGQATAKLLNALDMKVLAYDTFQSDAGKKLAEYVTLDELFARSDVIFLHCPLFPETEGIINKDNIEKMKDGVILINNSRGQLVVEQDLADALNRGKVYAAGLDVVSTEPIKGDNPLLKAKNCIITPHISWAAQASKTEDHGYHSRKYTFLPQWKYRKSGKCLKFCRESKKKTSGFRRARMVFCNKIDRSGSL